MKLLLIELNNISLFYSKKLNKFNHFFFSLIYKNKTTKIKSNKKLENKNVIL